MKTIMKYKSEKNLCETGEILEKDWDRAIEMYRVANLPSNIEHLIHTARAYYRHRKECKKCAVLWKETT